jgi:hypothetical protein
MYLTSVILICALLALLFLALSISAWKRVHVFRGSAHFLFAVVFALAATAIGLLGGTLLTYERLTHEQPVVEVAMKRLGDRHFQVRLTYPTARPQDFELLGDEWQIDARLLKWKGLAALLGFDTVYRLERIGGRYTDIAQEKTAPRTVHALNAPDTVDLWELARRGKDWAPFIDALYGSATYVPMADGAVYQVVVSPAGVMARPLNQAAKQSVGGWK